MQPEIKRKEFFTDVDLKKGNQFRAKITLVTSPEDFYVQKVRIYLMINTNYIKNSSSGIRLFILN